jgi:uncharacterized protein
MTTEDENTYTSFLGTGWSFPPVFNNVSGQVKMVSDEEDIEGSLKILLGTITGERFLQPKYGCGMQEHLFEAMSTTLQSFIKDKVKNAILIYEPRITIVSLSLDISAELEGTLKVLLEYEVRATNSRYNLVYPFYTTDASEVKDKVDFQEA